MADHETKGHSLYFSANFLATEKLRLGGTASLNMWESAFTAVDFDEAAIRARLVNDHHPDGDLENQTFEFSQMVGYSDLDYEIMQLGLSAAYDITQLVTLSVDGEYADLTDNAGYVYGLESGSFFVIRTGVKVQF
ncbi:MAG: hypothetical protein ABIE70_03370 [bacterium]